MTSDNMQGKGNFQNGFPKHFNQSKQNFSLNDFIMDFSDGKDSSLLNDDSEVRLYTQKFKHRRILFWVCLVICSVLYLIFALLLLHAWYCPKFFQILIDPKHIGAFIPILLIVPSALLWGLLRAAYMPENTKKEMDSLVKTASRMHPVSDD